MSELISADAMADVPLEDLLEGNFSDFEKSRDFVKYPRGVYIFDVKKIGTVEVEVPEAKGSTKKVKKQAMGVSLEPVEIVELKNPNDDQTDAEGIIEAKQMLDQNYLPGFGMQDFITRWEPVASELGYANLREFVENAAGCQVQVEVRHNKKGFVQLREIALVS